MFGFGMPELIVILVIVLVVFGAGRLPEIGGALGKSIRNFKKASDGKDEIEIKPGKSDDDEKRRKVAQQLFQGIIFRLGFSVS